MDEEEKERWMGNEEREREGEELNLRWYGSEEILSSFENNQVAKAVSGDNDMKLP